MLRLLRFSVLQDSGRREDKYFQMTVAAGGNEPHMVSVFECYSSIPFGIISIPFVLGMNYFEFPLFYGGY